MRRIGIAVHRFRPDALEVARTIAQWAHDNGCQAVIDEADFAAVNSTLASAGDVGDVDVLVSVGGDGTMLRAVRSLNGRLVPVVGVNLGLLGYLTGVEHETLIDVLAAWRSGKEQKDF